MPRHQAHRIDERAKRVFESSLPDSWVPRAQHPDYRIDYTIEIFDSDESSGLFWHVQLKGVRNPRRIKSNSALSFSMDVAHLEYYLDKLTMPVFLVLVDTNTREGWWLFLQQHINTQLRENWRRRSSAAIRLPMENSIRDSARLREAIESATEYMRELHPSSIPASMNAEKKRLESLDPRFAVDITATEREINYEIKPKVNDVIFTFHFKGEEAVAKAKELYESGGRVAFEGGEAEIAGMPAGWRDDYELAAIETAAKLPAQIRFSAFDDASGQQVNLDLNGEFARGSKRGKFTCELAGGLMRVILPLDSEKTQTRVSLQADFSKWVGVDVRVLPHLDAISPFFRLVATEQFSKGESFIDLEVFAVGNRVLASTGGSELTRSMQFYAPPIMALSDAREIARELDIAAIVPRDIGPRHAREIAVIRGLLKEGMYRFPAPGATASFIISKEAFDAQMENMRKKGAELSTFQGGRYPFLSTAVDIGYKRSAFPP